MKSRLFDHCRRFIAKFGLLPKIGASKRSAESIELVKSRPYQLEKHYELIDDHSEADGLFLRLRRSLFKEVDMVRPRRKTLGPKFLRESGKLDGGRPYFFIQPLSDYGWLFERSGAGWIVSKAEKIVQENKFLRLYDHWDIVTIHRPIDGNGTLRVSSERFNVNLVSFIVYEELLNQHLIASDMKA